MIFVSLDVKNVHGFNEILIDVNIDSFERWFNIEFIFSDNMLDDLTPAEEHELSQKLEQIKTYQIETNCELSNLIKTIFNVI